MTIEELSARVEKMESENSKLKRWGGLAALAVVGMAVIGQAAPEPKDMEVRSLTLRSEKGKSVARLFADSGGSPSLELHDEDGNLRASLGMGGIGAGLRIVDPSWGEVLLSPTTGLVVRQQVDGWPKWWMSQVTADGMVVSYVNAHVLAKKPEDWARVIEVKSGGPTEVSPRVIMSDKEGKVIERLPR